MADLNLNNQSPISNPTGLIFYGIKSDGGGGFDDWKITYADLISKAIPTGIKGQVLYNDGANWVVLGTGTDGYALTTHGVGADPTWEANNGGDVSKVGTPVNNEIGVWTGDGTLEGDTNLEWDGTNLDITGNIVITGTVDGIDIATDVAANNAKVSNVPTALSTGTRTTTTYGITSDSGTDDIVLLQASTTEAGILSSAKWDEIVANTLKVGNYNHTGDVTGNTALTIAVDAVDIPMLSASGSPSSSTFLRGDNSWSVPTGAGNVSKVGTPVDNQVGVWTGDGTIEGTTGLTYNGSVLDVTGDITLTGTVDGIDIAVDVAANTLKNTNVTTNLSLGAVTATTMIVASSDGTDATLIEADTDDAGLLGADKWDEIVANTLKISSYWTQDGTDLYYTGGNVGIETTAPNSLLEIGDCETTSTAQGNLYIKSDVNHKAIFIEENSGLESWGLGVNADGDLIFYDSGSSSNIVFQDVTGNVGINEASPAEKLDVDGNIIATGEITAYAT